MDPASFKSTILDFLREHQAFAEPLVFVLGFAEGIPLLSFVVPSSALFLAIGSAQGTLGGGLWTLWASAATGAMLGDCLTYGVGRHFKHRVHRIWPLSRHPERLARGHALFERWGAPVVVVGKFLGFMRPIIPVVAGIVHMPLAAFLLANALSSVIWAGAFLAPGWGLGRLFQ
jgi:membrane protein DedA with SNARE-associated domain